MDVSRVLLLLAVLGFAHSFECPRSNARGLFSNRQDCSKYYQCVGGGKYYTKNCPPGLWFDSRYSICNWPGYVSCHSEKPQIQPLASEEDDPVISGKIGRYPQQLGRQIHTTKKTPTYKTNPTTTQQTTSSVRPIRTTEPAASREHDAPRSPQAEKYTPRLDGSTRDPSPGPISSPQSVLDWLYEDHIPEEEAEVENVHPEAPQKEKVEASPINSVAAAMDEYGAFDEYDDDDLFAPPPECAAAFSLMLDPKRCEGFYQCYLWIPYPKLCPAGLLFDHKSNVCNWPEYVYCLNGERYDPPESTTGTVKLLETTQGTPPVPSNNFDPQGNYGNDEEHDTNYDDYWPIEGIEEGDRQQTAFKKKIIPDESSQTERRETTKTTTFKMPSKTTPEVKCRDGNTCEKQTVQTSDYKSHPKNIKSLNTKSSETYILSTQKKDTTAKESTNPQTTQSENLNYPKSPYQQPEDSSSSSDSDSKSSGKSVESSDSSFASSEEKQDGAESKSSEEINDIIEIKLTANNFQSKENNIQVEIVPVKVNSDNINDENDLLQQGSAVVSNATSTEVTEPAPEPTVNPVTEVTEAPEADNATSAEGSGSASNGTSGQSEGNSTESVEGSGLIVVLTKIDTLRNSVEKLLTETKPPPSTNSTKVTSTTEPTLNVSAEINGTEGNHSSILPANETSYNTNNVTYGISQETNSTTQIALNTTTETASLSPAEVTNATNVYKNSTNSSDMIVDSSNTTVNATAYIPESDSAAYRANSTDNKDHMDNNHNVKDNVKTDNVTKVSQNDTNNANDTILEDNTSTPLNNSVNETVTDAEFNFTTTQSEISTETANTTLKNDSSNTTVYTSVTSLSPTTVCSDGACNNTALNTTQTETKSAALASSKAVLKPKASRPDIVMLSGKSPIARILEKLLNIRMKQIGNNKFKAVSDKQKTGKGGLPSENKLPASPIPDQADVSTNVSSKPSKSSTSTTISTQTNPQNKSIQEETEASTAGTTTDVTYNTTIRTNATDVTNNSTEDVTVSLSENTTLTETTNNATVLFSNTTIDPSIAESNQTNSTFTMESQTNTTATTTLLTPKSTNDNSTDNSTTPDSETPQTTEVSFAHIHTTEAITSTTQGTNETATEESAIETDNVTTTINTTTTVEQLDANITETDLKNITIGETNALIISIEALNSTVLNSTQIINESSATTTTKPIEVNSTQTNETLNVTMSSTNETVEAMNGTYNETSLPVNETSLVSKTNNSISTDTTVKNTTNPTDKSTAKTESTSTRTATTGKASTVRKLRSTRKLSAEASRFRLHVKAPHFEARKVFGGPDERWRLSDGTLVDPFSRRQRDINTENQSNSASFPPASFLLITIMIVLLQLA